MTRYAHAVVWIPRPIRWAFSALTSTVMLYVFFFVPIGERTLLDHVKRIARTPEARDLGRDLGRASMRVAERTREELQQGLDLSAALGTDGGTRYRPDLDDGAPRRSASGVTAAPTAGASAALLRPPTRELQRGPGAARVVVR